MGGSSESSPVLRPAPGSLAAQEAAARIGLAPPGDSSPPVIDESPAVSALGWPHQAAEALEAASASQNPDGNPAASDVDSLLGNFRFKNLDYIINCKLIKVSSFSLIKGRIKYFYIFFLFQGLASAAASLTKPM